MAQLADLFAVNNLVSNTGVIWVELEANNGAALAELLVVCSYFPKLTLYLLC